MKLFFILSLLSFQALFCMESEHDIFLASFRDTYTSLLQARDSKIMTRHEAHVFYQRLQRLLTEVNHVSNNLQLRGLDVSRYTILAQLINNQLKTHDSGNKASNATDKDENYIHTIYNAVSAQIWRIESTQSSPENRQLARSLEHMALAYGFDDLYLRALALNPLSTF